MTPEELRETIARTICDSDDAGGDNWARDLDWYYAQADAVLAVVSPLLDAAREDGAREVLTDLGAWYRGLAEKHPRFADQSFLVLAQIERFATEHHPEKEKTDG